MMLVTSYVPDDDHPDDWGGDVGSDGEDNTKVIAEQQQAGGNDMNAMLAATSTPTAGVDQIN